MRTFKIFACLLSIFLFALAACDKTADKQPAPSKDSAVSQTLPLDAHMSKSYCDDLPGLLDKRYIRVLTTLNRTNFYVSEGHLAGYEYSLLKEYENFLNKQIK